MLIGITGTIGAGKGTIVSFLEGHGFRHVSVSGFLREEAVKRGKEATRVVRREIGNEYRRKGSVALIEEVLSDTNPAKEDVVVESLHTVPEVEYVRQLGGIVIAVDAPLLLRWERIAARADGKDASYDAFKGEQDRQMGSENPNENNLRAASEVADYRIENAGTKEELFKKLEGILSAHPS